MIFEEAGNCISNFTGVGSIGFESSFYATFHKEISIPKMSSYPIGCLSSVRTDFVSAATEFPEMQHVFEKLQKLQQFAFQSSTFKWTEIVLVKNLKTNNAFVQTIFKCKKEKQPFVEKSLDNLGIF